MMYIRQFPGFLWLILCFISSQNTLLAQDKLNSILIERDLIFQEPEGFHKPISDERIQEDLITLDHDSSGFQMRVYFSVFTQADEKQDSILHSSCESLTRLYATDTGYFKPKYQSFNKDLIADELGAISGLSSFFLCGKNELTNGFEHASIMSLIYAPDILIHYVFLMKDRHEEAYLIQDCIQSIKPYN